MRFCILALCLLGTMVSSGYGFQFEKRELGSVGGAPDASKYVPYVPDDDPYDINAIDQDALGTVGKLLAGVGDLTRGIVKGLEPSITALYTVLIPTVRIVLAGGKIKVCRPQSRLEVVVWFVKEFVNVQLNADLGVAQIPLCVPREEPKSLQKWAITYEVPKEMANDKPMSELMKNPEAAIGDAGDDAGAAPPPVEGASGGSPDSGLPGAPIPL
jgi:hypothetical protein